MNWLQTSTQFFRSTGMLGVLVACALALAAPVHADEPYPSRPIKLVIPFAPGGSNDTVGRALAEALGKKLGQSVVVDNRGGGGSTLGTDLVAKAAPDGYTLLFVSSSFTTNAAIKKSLPYDPLKDLLPVALVGASPLAVVVGNKFPPKTMVELLAYAKAHPGAINYGSAGVGGVNQLGTEMIASAAKVQFTHVPYKGMGPALTDMMGGQIQMALPGLPPVVQLIKAGQLRGLAVTSEKRSPLAPDIPTLAESGLPGFSLEIWWGVFAPANLPKPILAKLNESINEVITSPAMKDVFAREGVEARPGTPEAFATYVKAEIARWREVIKDANIPME
ncbi:MAG: tripartite tricarboxylate transporter substrate binding protein [Proteobacteria bacterium]|nr:tripartite tricarboxylate transporter substrate binding protein [Pseudomonadota bacterium]